MAKLIYVTNVSLDGCIEDERGAFDRLRRTTTSSAHHQCHAVRRHVSPRAAHVRDDGRVGDRLAPWPGSQTSTANYARAWHAADKVVYSSTLAAPLTVNTSARTPLRPRRGTRPEGRRYVGTCWSVARASRHRLPSPSWSTSSPCSSGQSSSAGATPHCKPTPAPISSSSTSTSIQQRRHSAPLHAFGNDAGNRTLGRTFIRATSRLLSSVVSVSTTSG